MLEFTLCSLVTILPDYLFRRFWQGKRWGQEINFFSLWYELRWGLTSCAMLTITLITIVFYYHPSTTNVSSFFRTITILPESGGRVSQVHITNNQHVEAGEKLFSIEGSSQKAAAGTARRKITEVHANMLVTDTELAAAIGKAAQAAAALQDTRTELTRKQKLAKQASAAVSKREVDRLESLFEQRTAALETANANTDSVKVKIKTLLPTQKATAKAALKQAEAEIAKLEVYAGVSGTVQQFTLRPGDYVSPVLRPAGILVPDNTGHQRFQAGFSQISAQVIHTGMLAEITCISQPFTIIPMVVVGTQKVIAAGQIRPTDQLLDLQERARPGTLAVYMEPLYANQVDGIPPGSKCVANAYSNFHEEIESGKLSTANWLFYHMVDTVALVHAMILRIQALLLPVKVLVFSGH